MGNKNKYMYQQNLSQIKTTTLIKCMRSWIMNPRPRIQLIKHTHLFVHEYLSKVYLLVICIFFFFFSNVTDKGHSMRLLKWRPFLIIPLKMKSSLMLPLAINSYSYNPLSRHVKREREKKKEFKIVFLTPLIFPRHASKKKIYLFINVLWHLVTGNHY